MKVGEQNPLLVAAERNSSCFFTLTTQKSLLLSTSILKAHVVYNSCGLKSESYPKAIIFCLLLSSITTFPSANKRLNDNISKT